MEKLSHVPVMLEECLNALNLSDGKIYFDGTIGGAGHSYEILKRTKNSRLYATDLDTDSIERATERLKEFDGRFFIENLNYKEFYKVKEKYNIEGFDGILLDFGMSSFQIDDKKRGFSYLSGEYPLDMRMKKDAPLSAKEVVNNYSEKDLERILREYGEEKFSKKIAENIVKERNVKPIETCGELVDIIEKSIPKKFQVGGHPAKRTFQAIRIEVNDELNDLENAVKGLARSLNKGGRIAIITFHSLEDRIVKNAFKDLNTDCVCPKNFPVCVCGKKKEIEIITKHPITPTEEEMEINSRSKSAKLRIAEKI